MIITIITIIIIVLIVDLYLPSLICITTCVSIIFLFHSLSLFSFISRSFCCCCCNYSVQVESGGVRTRALARTHRYCRGIIVDTMLDLLVFYFISTYFCMPRVFISPKFFFLIFSIISLMISHKTRVRVESLGCMIERNVNENTQRKITMTTK